MRTRMNLLMVTALVVWEAGGRAFGAVVVDSQSFKGSQAATSFSGSVTIACAAAGSGTVSASGFTLGIPARSPKTTGSPTTVNNGVFIEVDTYSNTCTGATLSGSPTAASPTGSRRPTRT